MAWPTKKLGEVLEINYGKGLPKDSRVDSGKYFAYGSNGPVYNTNESLANDEVIVIGRKGTAGALYFVSEPCWPIDTTFFAKPKNDASLKFIYYLLQTKKLPRLAIVTGVPGINRTTLANIKIQLPSLEIQKQIVERLDKIAEAQKLNDELIQKSDELFQSLLHQELNPAGPADAKAMAGKKDWEAQELGEVALLVRGPFGGSLRKDIFVESGDCVYEQGNVIDGDLKNFRYFVTPEKFRQMKRFEVLAGDILMSCSGTIGKFVIIPRNFKKGIINQALLKITPNRKAIGEFLKFTLENYFALNKSHVKGIAIKNIAAVKELKKVKISLPPLETQKQIVEKLSAVQEYKGRLLEQKSKLKEFFDSVLHKSMQA